MKHRRCKISELQFSFFGGNTKEHWTEAEECLVSTGKGLTFFFVCPCKVSLGPSVHSDGGRDLTGM